MGADDRSRSPVNARLGDGIQPSKKAATSAEFTAAETAAAQSAEDRVSSCSSSRDLHGCFNLVDLAHKPRCRIVSLDLAEDHAWEVSEYIADACDVTAVHLAPPCGTCSKAGGYAGIPMTNGV